MFSINFISAQEKLVIKFGKISPSDFIVNSPVVESNANAVVLADIGSCEFEGNRKGWFTLIFKRHKRIKILNKNGYDAATMSIGLYKDGDAAEQLNDLKAVTYNLENGKVVETKLDSKSLFEDKVSKNLLVKKFTYPGVKEGSIVECTYTIKSDFLFNLQPWEFQGEYPCLWSEYQINIPSIFNYIILKQGNLNYYINQQDIKNAVYNINDESKNLPNVPAKYYVVNTNVIVRKWAIKDMPAMAEQDYSSTTKNYISKLEFQLSQYRFPDEPPQEKMSDWPTVSAEMMKYDDFGKPLLDENVWMDDELNNIVTHEMSDEQKARNIYAFIKNSITCTNTEGLFLSPGANLQNIFKKKNGSVSDINLLLVAMMRHEGLKADPVILSTKDNGVIHPQYPIMQKFNYVLCRVKINETPYYLDATNPFLGFSRLEPKCYNGQARVISDQPEAVYLKADGLSENKNTSVNLINGSSGMTGEFISHLGYNESLRLRESLSKQNQGDYFKNIEKSFLNETKLENGAIDSINALDKPLVIHYNFKLNPGEENFIYFNPMLNEGIKQNPFKAQQRLYPVEMPYCKDEIYNLRMEIPKGYKIEEIPKSGVLTLNNNEGKFEYLVTQAIDHIEIRCRLKINQTTFSTEDYITLRNFYTDVVRMENEQLVFKKIL